MERNIFHRQRILRMIEQAWKQHPELRLGQLLMNVMNHDSAALYYLDDEILIANMQAWIEHYKMPKTE